MQKILFFVMIALAFVGCSKGEDFNLQWNPVSDELGQSEKAYSDFLQRPIVREFAADGVRVDCEKSICSQISDRSLEALRKYKPQFIQNKSRITYITLSKEDYPIYHYRLEGAYIPAALSEELLGEFFRVFKVIQDFENEVGFKIEFPNSRYLENSLLPLLEILKANKASLLLEAHRFDTLVVNSVYNDFVPDQRVLMVKLADVRESFSDLWKFMSLFFKSQDLFGDVGFGFDKADNSGVRAMQTLFQNAALFQPLLAQLQGRRISFYEWEFYGYSDNPTGLMDLGLSSSYDKTYLEAVFRDQIRVMDLSARLGIRVRSWDSIIDLNGHSECLDKVEAMQSEIKNKRSFLTSLLVGSGELVPSKKSSFDAGALFLNCTQTIDEMKTVVDGIK